MKKTIVVAAFLVSILFLGLPAESGAQPVLNPENGHYYECVPCGRNWAQANQYASSLTFDGLRGHLATITTPEEDAFIAGLGCGLSWLGGFQSPSAAQPDQDWLWITGEPFIYTAWAPGEPSGDCVGNDCESCLELSGELGGWNDLPCPDVRECVVEYEEAVVQVSPIPTLSEWGMIAAAAGFALVGMFYAMRKRRASA